MNAIAAQQTAFRPTQNLDLLQELANLGMILVRIAAQEVQAQAQAQAFQPAETARPRRADPRLIFLRLATLVRETIALQTCIANGHSPAAPRARSTPKPPTIDAASDKPQDPRRALILRYFREGIDLGRQKSKIATSQQIVETHIDAELAKDPNHRLAGRDLLLKICKSLDLPFYATRMPPGLAHRHPA